MLVLTRIKNIFMRINLRKVFKYLVVWSLLSFGISFRLLEELEQEKEELEKRLDGTEGINVKEMVWHITCLHY